MPHRLSSPALSGGHRVSLRPLQDTVASVKQRLFNIAKERSEDFNFLLTCYVVERLLYRLGKSEHAGDFVLKGAMLFHLGPDQLPRRPTRDVDLLGKGSADLARLEEIFRALCKVQIVDDGLVFVEKSVRAERIREGEEYQGVRVHLEACMGSARIQIQVDIGFGDALTPRPKKRRLAALLPDLPAPCLLVCPWETVIAEKFQVLVDLGIANSGMKDFFDLRYLATTLTLDGTTLARAIQATFKRRRTPLPIGVPVGLSPAFGEDTDKQTQWRAFLGRLHLDAGKESLSDVVSELRDFLMPPVEALVKKLPFTVKWPPGGPWSPS